MPVTTMIPARGPIRAAGAPHARRRGLAATAHRLAVDLTPQAVEQIAGRVAQLLRHDLSRTETNPAPAPGWMTAKELASHLKLNPAWVYEHAEELGVIRTGDGPKARMRFDLQTATQALQRHRRQTAPVGQAPKSRMPRRQPFGPGDAGAPLLEIRRREIRGVRSCFAPRRVRMGRV